MISRERRFYEEIRQQHKRNSHKMLQSNHPLIPLHQIPLQDDSVSVARSSEQTQQLLESLMRLLEHRRLKQQKKLESYTQKHQPNNQRNLLMLTNILLMLQVRIQ